jgi:hypothetical protein
MPDIHCLKENIVREDGSVERKLTLIDGYKRDFYITKKSARNHKEKKELESLDNLMTFSCTEDELPYEIKRKLGEYNNGYISLRDACDSPYVYGSEFPSTSEIMMKHRARWGAPINTPYICSLDIETDVFSTTQAEMEHGEVIMITVCGPETAYLVVKDSWYNGMEDLLNKVSDRCRGLLLEYLNDAQKNVVVELSERGSDIIRKAFDVLHGIKPDIVYIWNMSFDIPCILNQLERDCVDPRSLCDPIFPDFIRKFEWKPGRTFKISEAGVRTNIPIESRWNWVEFSGSWQFIDQMCLYDNLRTGRGKEDGYSLEKVAKRKVGFGKLTKEVGSTATGTKWHEEMQTDHKLNYSAYCIADGLLQLAIENKTRDGAITLPTKAGITSYRNLCYVSMIAADDTHANLLKLGYSLGTVGTGELRVTPNILPRSGWITTLDAGKISDVGLKIIEEMPEAYTSIVADTQDDDSVSAYPRVIATFGVSMGTTSREIASVKGISLEKFRRNIINIASGPVNAISVSVDLLGYPTIDELLSAYELEHTR